MRRGPRPPSDGLGYQRRPDGAFPYRTSPLLKDAPAATGPGVSRALELAGLRWNLAIVSELRRGAARFNELRDSLGISQKMLVRRLHMLRSYGVVERRPAAMGRNVFEYALTDSGHELHAAVAVLNQWGSRNLPEPEQSPRMTLGRA